MDELQTGLHLTRAVMPLRVWRVALGKSQSELAAEAGLDRTTIIRLEAGEHPSLKTANAVANVIGVDREALFPPEGSKT